LNYDALPLFLAVNLCSSFDYFSPVRTSQEHNSLEHQTNFTGASNDEQQRTESSIQAQPLPIAGSIGTNYFVVPSICHF
jgi:hypothetical protein